MTVALQVYETRLLRNILNMSDPASLSLSNVHSQADVRGRVIWVTAEQWEHLDGWATGVLRSCHVAIMDYPNQVSSRFKIKSITNTADINHLLRNSVKRLVHGTILISSPRLTQFPR